MSSSGSILMGVFFVILTVGTLALTTYDMTGDRNQKTIMGRFSSALVENTAAIVGATLQKITFNTAAIDDAMAAYLLNHPQHMELSSVLNREINACRRSKNYKHYCMAYHIDTRDLDMGDLPQALPVSQNISDRIENMHGCYISGSPFKLCLYQKNG